MITVAIIGAGPLGRWLALSAARAGFRVLLEDVMPTNLHHAQEYIRRQLSPQGLDGKADGEAVSSSPIRDEHTDFTPVTGFRGHQGFAEDTGLHEGAIFHPTTLSANVTGDLPATDELNPIDDLDPVIAKPAMESMEQFGGLKGTGLDPYFAARETARALGDAEKLSVLKGHEISRAASTEERSVLKGHEISRAASTEERSVLKGHDFSRAASTALSTGALAPEAGFSAPLPIQFVSTIEDAVRNADLVIDCVPDELESKLEILFLLDRMAPPRTVLATPTTRLSIVDLASCTYRAEKCVAIVAEARDLAENPALEILLRTTPQTSLETVALVRAFWLQLGFAPRFLLDPAPSLPSA